MVAQCLLCFLCFVAAGAWWEVLYAGGGMVHPKHGG